MLSVGSRTPELQKLVVDIFRLCTQHNIQLVPEWIPTEENISADEISKSIDVDDYMLSPDIFAVLDILPRLRNHNATDNSNVDFSSLKKNSVSQNLENKYKVVELLVQKLLNGMTLN